MLHGELSSEHGLPPPRPQGEASSPQGVPAGALSRLNSVADSTGSGNVWRVWSMATAIPARPMADPMIQWCVFFILFPYRLTGVSSFIITRRRTPKALPVKPATSHNHPCRLPEEMPASKPPMLQPKASRAP